MKILSHLKSGATRSLKSWKGVLIIWFSMFVMISILSSALKSGFKSMIGSSMVTELLTNTINLDVISDLQQEISVLIPSITTGFMLLILFTFLLNAFITGGLFSILGSKCNSKSLSCFFAGGASNFWSFLVVNLIVSLIFIILSAIIGGIPALIVSKSGSGTPEPGAMGKVIRISMIVLALLLPVILLVADYARSWQVYRDIKKPFNAIGAGFAMTFRKFLVSYPIMLIAVLIQAGYGVLVISKLLGSKPSTGGGVLMLFLSSQILFIVKIFFRGWRYGCVTSLFEEAEVTAVSQDQSVPVVEPQPGQA